MRITARSTLQEVAFVVCTALHRAGVTAVLTGGSAAAIHAPQAIQSLDLDFVLCASVRGGSPAEALRELGYAREGQDYVHATSRYQLEFPAGPLSIGDDLVRSWETLHRDELLLHVLTATDSCRDRLAHFYYFHDRAGLAQALEIAAARPRDVDHAILREWSDREGQLARYEEFAARLGSGPAR